MKNKKAWAERNAAKPAQGTTDHLGRSRRSHQGSDFRRRARQVLGQGIVASQLARTKRTLHVFSAIEPSLLRLGLGSEWARSLWIVECCSAGRIARDLEGAVERERLIDYALLRAKPQDSPADREGRTRHSRVVAWDWQTVVHVIEFFFFFSNN